MVSNRVRVMNDSGLHARPASVFVKAAKAYQSDITICKCQGGANVNAKSIARILCEAITKGTEIEIAAHGSDEKEAVDYLAELIESGFGE